MKQMLLVKADYCDADYVYSETVVTDENRELITDFVEAVKSLNEHTPSRIHNHPLLKKYHGDDISELIPYGYNGLQIKRILSIRLLTVSNEEVLV